MQFEFASKTEVERRLWKRAIDDDIFPEFAIFNLLRLMILT